MASALNITTRGVEKNIQHLKKKNKLKRFTEIISRNKRIFKAECLCNASVVFVLFREI